MYEVGLSIISFDNCEQIFYIIMEFSMSTLNQWIQTILGLVNTFSISSYCKSEKLVNMPWWS